MKVWVLQYNLWQCYNYKPWNLHFIIWISRWLSTWLQDEWRGVNVLALLDTPIGVVQLAVAVDLVWLEPALELPPVCEFYGAFALLHIVLEWSPVLIIIRDEMPNPFQQIVLEMSFDCRLIRVDQFPFTVFLAVLEAADVFAAIVVWTSSFALQYPCHEVASADWLVLNFHHTEPVRLPVWEVASVVIPIAEDVDCVRGYWFSFNEFRL